MLARLGCVPYARTINRDNGTGDIVMGRLVRKPSVAEVEAPQTANEFGGMFQAAPRVRPASAAMPGDDYLTRMVKYIPAEVIGGSMLVNAILQQAMVAGGDNAAMAGFSVTSIAIGALVVGLVLTPLFCWYVREDGDAWTVNAIVSTVAFPFWAYLMGAVAFSKFHDGNLAVILILTFTAVSGLVAPVAEMPRAAQELKNPNPKEGPRLVENLKG
jgi:hypothetical protein